MIELPWPHKILWPNGRGHHMAKHRQNMLHRTWAYTLALEAKLKAPDGTVRLAATFHPKTRNAVDADNASASLKAYQDGIAAYLGIDDSAFAEPKITFAEPIKGGRVFIALEAV